MKSPVFHKFVVYSKFKEDNIIEEKLVRCNNCDAVHRVIDLCRSEIVIKIEETDTILDEEEIKLALSDKIIGILEKNNSDIATYESIDHIINENAWGSQVVISRQTVGNEKTHIKILEINGENKFRLKSETIDILTDA
jgi:hypothetical protein